MTEISHPACPKNHAVKIFKTFQIASKIQEFGAGEGERRAKGKKISDVTW